MYSSTNIFLGIKSRRMRWATHKETGEVHTGFWWGDLIERDHLLDLGVDVTIILRWIFKEWCGEAWTGLIWLRIGTGGELL
jgi:hypothetical protein